MAHMDKSTNNVGYSEMPPLDSSAVEEQKREEKPFPHPDRPVYTVRPSDEGDGGFRFKGIIIVLLGILVAVGILFAATYFNAAIPNREPAVKAAPTVSAPAPELGTLKVEVTRTMQLLEEMAAESAGDPEKLEEIEKLQGDSREILDSIGTGGP